jgi:ubiquinone/menaquinone biosynthesis C-methylase UbiE
LSGRLFEKAKEIRKLWSAFWTSRPLITAVNLGLFEHTAEEKTAPQVAKRIKAYARATGILLDALAGLGLLKKTKGLYRNTPEADLFLVKSSPYYQGAIVRHADNLWKSWSHLDEVVRTGRPAPREKGAFDLGAFILGMHNLAVLKAESVIKKIGMKGVGRALDLGGGPGTYAMEMRRQGVEEVILFDLPDVIKIAQKHTKKLGFGGMKFLRGDFMKGDIGRGYDLVFMSNIHHSHSEGECLNLMKKVKASLNPGGRGVIHEFYMKANRAEPSGSALFSINMLVNTPSGRCYTDSELRGFFREAGFKGVKQAVLNDTILVQGRA